MQFHNPVLLKESVALLSLKKGSIFVDATLGGGGHSEAILKSTQVKHVYAIDQDEEAILFASDKLKQYHEKITFIKANFKELRAQLALRKVKGIDGIIFDLGVSSHQLDAGERGFSFEKNAALDMRMDKQSPTTIKELLKTLSVEEMTKIFRDFGEEQSAYKIAQWIENERKIKHIETTLDLSNIIEKNMRCNPALVIKTKARIFQALRIYLNQELESLQTGLDDALNLLHPNGRIVVISYHSLEDRIVKTTFAKAAKGCICPTTILKCMCNQKTRVKFINKKAIMPSEEELKANSRSRSAKLRAVEKI
jgi:16S rRNA (cytosine1402-N4)-methyltransferase